MLYRQQHGGAEPPADFRDAAWLRWRADILNTFAARVHREVKAIKPHLLVTWSPSVYPWSYEEYLQDWPAWVRAGHADLVHPQVYRYSHEEYLSTLATQTPAALGLSGQKNIIYPGVLISLGPYLIPDDELTGAVATNRAMGFNGEVFFFFEGLRPTQRSVVAVNSSTRWRCSPNVSCVWFCHQFPLRPTCWNGFSWSWTASPMHCRPGDGAGTRRR